MEVMHCNLVKRTTLFETTAETGRSYGRESTWKYHGAINPSSYLSPTC